MQIVSLLPSLTETCYILGLDRHMAAVTHECDYPELARTVPRITRSVVPLELTDSAEIDRIVRETVAAGQPLYELDTELLAELEPDLILTQDLCPVCALSADDVRLLANRLPKQPQVASFQPTTIDGILESIIQVGHLTGGTVTAETVVDTLRKRIQQVELFVKQKHNRPRTVCLEWLDPPMVAGHWVPEMIALAGGQDVLGQSGHNSYFIDWQTIIDAEPEVILLMPCGYTLEQAASETIRLAGSPSSHLAQLQATPAGQTGRVYAVDASAHFSRPGPRVVIGIKTLAHLLHLEVADGVDQRVEAKVMNLVLFGER